MNRPDDSLEVLMLDEDEDAFLAIAGESLMNYGVEIWKRYLDRIGRDNARSVRRDGRCVGGMAFYRMGQWFGGKLIPAGGFSAVAISPADRGTGTGQYLIESVLRDFRAEGLALASLFASTQVPYRRVGFEQAGTQTIYTLPIHSFDRGHDRSCPVHRVESPSADTLARIAEKRAKTSNGQLNRNDALWQRLLHPNDQLHTITYLFGDLFHPEGYAIFKANDPSKGIPQTLVATDLCVSTPRAMQRLVALIRDHRSTCYWFQWPGAPNDPLLMTADEARATVKDQERWMLRLVDLPVALSSRGYPADLKSTLHLEISDELIPANAGRWQLLIEGGSAVVLPDDAESGGQALKMDIGTLATLYSSYMSATELAGLGRIESATHRELEVADRAFAGPRPWMPEIF